MVVCLFLALVCSDIVMLLSLFNYCYTLHNNYIQHVLTIRELNKRKKQNIFRQAEGIDTKVSAYVIRFDSLTKSSSANRVIQLSAVHHE